MIMFFHKRIFKMISVYLYFFEKKISNFFFESFFLKVFESFFFTSKVGMVTVLFHWGLCG